MPSSLNSKTSLIFIIILTAAILVLFYRTFSETDKIGYVVSGKILEQYKGAGDAKKAYEKKAAIWQQNIETLTNEVRSDIASYEKTLATASPSEQKLAKQLIGSKQKQLSDYQRGVQENARQEDEKLTKSVVSRVNAFLTEYGKVHHYKLILIANQSGAIAYAADGLDITDQVIKELNEQYIR